MAEAQASHGAACGRVRLGRGPGAAIGRERPWPRRGGVGIAQVRAPGQRPVSERRRGGIPA